MLSQYFALSPGHACNETCTRLAWIHGTCDERRGATAIACGNSKETGKYHEAKAKLWGL